MRFIIWFLLAFTLNYVTSIGSVNTQTRQIRTISTTSDTSHSSTEILFARSSLNTALVNSSPVLLNNQEDILERSDGVIDGFTSASLKSAISGSSGGNSPSLLASPQSTQFDGEEVGDFNERSPVDAKNYSNIITSVIHFDTPLNHLVVDTFTGRVFVGGVNYLYQLSPELELHETVKTGPKNDSVECTVLDCPAHAIRKPADNYNKVLLIDRATSRLIACGSLFQGTCTVRNLQNVSIVEQDVPDAVVANDANSSTVAFIAPGPPQPPITNVMYVGVTYTNNSPYRSEIPAVASRSLEKPKIFQIASSAVTTGTRTFINSYAREGYLINYVYGFSSERFSYFLTTQLKHNYHSSPKEYITKLVRICQEDSNYYSYTEIPIDCITGGTKYNLVQAGYLGKPSADLAGSLGITVQDDVLYGAFSVGNGNLSTDNSALCIYSLKSIRRKFMQNIKSCFNGVGSRGLGFISPNMPCVPTKLQTIGEDFCGLDVNSPLGGEQPITVVPVAMFNTRLTAVAATSTSGYTVVFIGTANGYLKKVVVESADSANEYDNIPIKMGSPINSDMHFDSRNLYIYVMSRNEVAKVKVFHCSDYSTCGECLGARDPYCGWCSLENKCSPRSSCEDDANDPLYWVSYKTGKCTTITSVVPHQLQRTTARTLELIIDHLPQLKENLVCAFTTEEKALFTNATKKRNGVNCTTPRTDMLPQIEQGKHHFTAKLSVRTKDGPDLVSTDFTFFDCSTHSSCTRCVSSEFPCDWCVEAHRCTHDTAENCRNDILVTGVSRIGPSYRSGPGFCPTINATGEGSEMLVAAGTSKSIKVKVHIIGQFIVQTRFVCQFNIEGRVTSLNAQLLGDTIYCDTMEFQYTSRSPNLTATFAVIWGGSKPLDNPHDIHVVIYRCRDMADSCGMCLALAEKYNCGWCSSTNTCEVEEQCNKNNEGKTDWLNRMETCPNPEIHSFYPKTGPWEGGTNITIRGINLGKNFTDIYSGVRIAGINCMPFQQYYIATKEIRCNVDSPGVQLYRNGRIVVQIGDYRGESKEDYEFVDPKITNFSPQYGPVSGGTHVRIIGKYLNAGSRIQAFINEHLPCEILSVDVTQAICRTAPSPGIIEGRLKILFDNGQREFNEYNFKYVLDPSIEQVSSGPSGQLKVPRGIPAGGIEITVTGTQFNYIQSPRMYVYYKSKIFYSQCKVESATEMICYSPVIETDNDILDAENPELLEYGFLMDSVLRVQNLSSTHKNNFELYPNPLYYNFEEHIKYYKSEYLTINGRNLDRACKETDVVVRIGKGICNITSLSRQQLTCRPPPESATESGPGPEVIVRVGQSLEYRIGVLSYASPNLIHDLSKNVLLVIGVCTVLILIIFVALLVAYKKKTSESNRVLRNMQEQMDILELRVAAECKEAFAELQTEMTDLTGDLTSGGIPFLDYRTYAMKILFPNHEDHIVLQWERPELLRKEKGLRLFGQLIMNKTFLLLFIRTLESNRYFSMRERVNVASLIMVTLQSKLEYCTDILKTLLGDLIEKCIEGKSHPKLLLRRTESVAEKMLSAWFTFLLYKFLKECAGEPLYMLFRAVKGQVDKGPVDACTHEARYSLSEEKLIRQLIDFRPMTVYASIIQQPIFCNSIDMMPTHTENVPVKVLDCDTIGQVKEKCLDTIYRNIPWSQRPRKDDLDLEWRTGASGRVILYDEDTTSKTESEWKKLNTLQHYNVPDGAGLSLVPKQSSNYNFSILSDKNEKCHKYETLNLSKYTSSSPTFSRAGSPLNNDLHENGIKFWHLVKHHDSDIQKEGERVNKLVSEIYLTRLLATKGTLQKFVDDLFETIFSTAHRGSALPLAIKYMFDFLDDQALLHGITDHEVVHTWKSNSLPLRFWVNLIKNPNFVFDIHKSNIVDSCLSVVAQTFMDSCSTSDHRLGKDSPSSKLLYAKDIPEYRKWVERYYRDIREMSSISDQDMNAMLAEESRLHTTEFNTNCALHELYTYAVKYNEQLTVTLEEDEFSQKQRLAFKLEQVHNMMSGE
ncbi:plexin-A2 isoform X1 [Anastrepha obliqua]|uniref:plexin-A2 isoform X1 n=1 Tax=Anastrepha obliqua TaxID=95512 RepID=UPI0024093BBF|nr:plexin-A2 isoform X1 [Anastrepha obliqua]XP_054746804.1 plexin-A2 isoform X1 [Anastrepha obliqua]XP_054746805.1 plexin-A2 isoform X1 [Anastrepha obliqua]XP_054746806.1 plexin-A2 isoform X1 [Anastrepha obliqua]XP_054746807.1 plexin-A2 isoform X1 [Anastrepha obliqua]